MHFEQWEQDEIEVKLILKGGGCENKNIQYSLPAALEHLGKAAATWKVCVSAFCTPCGRRRARAARPARWACASAAIARMATTLRSSNSFARSTMRTRCPNWPSSNGNPGRGESPGRRSDGLRRQVSLIGCKITAANRLPASFFVSVAYECWAFRRLGVRLDAERRHHKWLYRDPSRPVEK